MNRWMNRWMDRWSGTGGFSLLEVLLAIALIALLAGLSVPRLQSQAERTTLLHAQAKMLELAGDIAGWHSLYQRTEEEIRSALPDGIYSDTDELLYSLRFEMDAAGNWMLYAEPSSTQNLAAMQLGSDGSCRMSLSSTTERDC